MRALLGDAHRLPIRQLRASDRLERIAAGRVVPKRDRVDAVAAYPDEELPLLLVYRRVLLT